MKNLSKALAAGIFLLPFTASPAWADIYGQIRGTVTDSSGAVVAGAKITVTNVATGISNNALSASDGNFEFPQLAAPGTYNVTAELPGFKTFESRGIPLSLNQIYVLNITLAVGMVTQELTVQATPTQVETTSIELGTTVNSRSIVDLPLNGRNWVQLQQLEPGVVAASDGRGNYATNGSQADQNSYLINGTDNNEFILNTALITPSPDAIGEFKMVTNTINPEYGRNSGAILNAVIKSGTNQSHGDGFDFYRDTSLNARNFFAPLPAVFHRNQYGGTIGGPIKKNKTFFFFSFQGTCERRPELSSDCGCGGPGVTPVFTNDQRGGVFTDLATSTGVSPFALVGENGKTYPAGTPYSTLFPTGHIPAANFNSISAGPLKFLPTPRVGTRFQFNPVFKALDDQYLGRIDHTFSSKDSIWGYWLWERQLSNQTLPFTGATVPGFPEKDQEHFGQYAAAWNHTFGTATLNEARVGYARFNFLSVAPAAPVAPSTAGFSINPQLVSGEGLPVVNLAGLFSVGFSSNGPQPRLDSVYQATDSLTKIVGRHTFKAGVDLRWFEVYNPFSHQNDGVFNFFGTGPFTTGDPGADFMLGVMETSAYSQGSGDILNLRTREYYSYVQDQWKLRNNLTVTYGVGWSIDTPTSDNYHNNHAGIAFRPGQQSTVFPTRAAGLRVSG